MPHTNSVKQTRITLSQSRLSGQNKRENPNWPARKSSRPIVKSELAGRVDRIIMDPDFYHRVRRQLGDERTAKMLLSGIKYGIQPSRNVVDSLERSLGPKSVQDILREEISANPNQTYINWKQIYDSKGPTELLKQWEATETPDVRRLRTNMAKIKTRMINSIRKAKALVQRSKRDKKRKPN